LLVEEFFLLEMLRRKLSPLLNIKKQNLYKYVHIYLYDRTEHKTKLNTVKSVNQETSTNTQNQLQTERIFRQLTYGKCICMSYSEWLLVKFTFV